MHTAGHVVFLAWTILISLFGIAVVVQFVRKRNSVYLQGRFPYISLLQLSVGFVGWIAFAVVLFTQNLTVRCVADLAIGIPCVNTVFLAMFFRIWGLFWRIYLGKYLAESRKRLHTQLSLLNEDQAKLLLKSRSRKHARCKCIPQRTLLQLLKFSLPGLFGTLTTMHTLASIVSVASLGVCDSYGEKFTTMQLLVFPLSLLVWILSAVIAFVIRKFRDSVGINTEIKRLFLAQAIFFPLMILFVIIQQAVGGLFDLPYIIAMLSQQSLFVVSGFIPLRDQRRLERKVQSSNFGDLGSFETVLNDDAAALVALQKFMKREFCEEMLEFSQAVNKFRDAHSLSTEQEQIAMARVIFAQFIAADAPAQINISVDCLEKIALTMFNSTSVTGVRPGIRIRQAPIDVFDAAQAEMHKLMREGPFMRFQISDLATATARDDGKTDKSDGNRKISAAQSMRRLLGISVGGESAPKLKECDG